MKLSTNYIAGLRIVAPLSSVRQKLAAEPHGRSRIVFGRAPDLSDAGDDLQHLTLAPV
jgi:hypothetical protein